MTDEPFIYFFYRTPYENVLGRRLVKVKAESILHWFQRGWDVAQNTNRDLDEWEAEECKGGVYGLSSIFDNARELNLPRPTSRAELNALIDKHLYVEAGVDHGVHTLQVLTDDDEMQLGYFFFEPVYVEKNPGVVKYLFTEFDDLAELAGQTHASQPFVSPVPVEVLDVRSPEGECIGTTYLCFMTWHDGENFNLIRPQKITGLRLPDFCDYMLKVKSNKLPVDHWPVELRLMKEWVDESDNLYSLLSKWNEIAYLTPWNKKIEDQTLPEMRANRLKEGNPEKSKILVAEHFSLLCSHVSGGEYYQLFFFDDIWVGANPLLAESILRYSYNWDPFSDGKRTY